MSDRHMHITGYLYDETPAVERFIAAARSLEGGFFQEVIPVLRDGDSRIRAVAFYSKDLDGISDELEMPDVAEKLSGILTCDVVIVSAWDHPPYSSFGAGRQREHAWLVRGTSRRGPDVNLTVREGVITG